MTHRVSATGFTGRLLAAALVSAGLFCAGLFGVTSSPQAQGTLISPGGQPRVTAPGGLRGRAALKHRYTARRRMMQHRRHR